MTPPILSVRDLRVAFATRRGVLSAVDGVSFDIAQGEVLGVVGESGAGKSVTGAAVMGLIDPPGRITGGEISLAGRRIDNLPPETMRRIRGKRIGPIVQDPLASLDPLYRIGDQLIETIRTHAGLSRSAARQRAADLLAEVASQPRSNAKTATRMSFRAACASASSSRLRSAPNPISSSPTSRQPLSTFRRRRKSSRFSRALFATAAWPSCSSPTTWA
jgi:ABC-type glutathione transport system ATPase component